MRKQQKLSLLSAALLSVVATASFTEDVKVNDPSWKGNVELGIVNTTGNTETETINAKAKAETEREKWRHTLAFESLNSSDKGKTTAESYTLNGQSSYKTSDQNYFFATLGYEDVRFSGYDYRLSEALGYGRRVIHDPALTLDLEIGPGARQSKLSTGGTDDEATVRGAAKLAWKIAKTSSFTEDFTIVAGQNSTITKSVTALTAQVNGSLATKITYTIQNNSDVPVNV